MNFFHCKLTVYNHRLWIVLWITLSLFGCSHKINIQNQRHLKSTLAQLTDESLEGRKSGSNSFNSLTDSIAGYFKSIGLEAYNDASYIHTLTIPLGRNLTKNSFLKISSPDSIAQLTLGIDYTFQSISGSGPINTSCIRIVSINEIAHAKRVNGCLVVINKDPKHESPYQDHHHSHSAHATSRMYNELARKGAQAVAYLVDILPKAGTSFSPKGLLSKIPVLIIRKDHFAKLHTTPEKSIYTISGIINLESKSGTTQNVIAKISFKESHLPPIIIGAHLDHLGRGFLGASGDPSKLGEIHYGADDNASGSSVVIELAKQLVSMKKQHLLPSSRDIYFALWSGEEIGLLGSTAFINSSWVDGLSKKYARPFDAYINLDMVGRLDEKLIVQGVGTSSAWNKLINKSNEEIELNVVLQQGALLPTDSSPFYQKGIPICNFFTGLHEDYHKPSDTLEKINFNGLERIFRLTKTLTLETLAYPQTLDFIAVSPQRKHGAGPLKAYLGSIPDYSAIDTIGVPLSGVAPQGPADSAGLRKGDIIKQLGTYKIKHIYDLTDALSSIEPEKPTQVRIERDGKILTLPITLQRR